MHIAERCQACAKRRVYCAVRVHMWERELFTCICILLHVARRAPHDVYTVLYVCVCERAICLRAYTYCFTLPGALQMTCTLCCVFVVNVCVYEREDYTCISAYCSTSPGARRTTCILCCVCAYVRKWIMYLCICILLYVPRRAPCNVHIYIYTCIYMNINIYTYIYIYIYIYIYMYI